MGFAWKGTILCGVLLVASIAQAKTIRVGGGAAPINNIFRRVEAAYSKSTGNTLVLSEEGPDLALVRLDEGKLDAAAAGVSFEDWIKLVESKGKTLAHSREMKYRTIGRDLIQIYANQGVGVSELSKEQLAGIFSGAIKNWMDVGGSAAPIQVVMGSKITGTNVFFRKEILGASEFSKAVIWVETAPEIIQKLAKTPNSIGFGPIGVELKGLSVKSVRGPELGRPIVFATRGVPGPELAELLRFLESPEARALIRR